MTPQQLLEFTYCRFKFSVLGLMFLISAFLFYNVFHHSVSLVVLIYALIYIIVLNVGLRGATNRNIPLIRFYWVFQLVQLVVFLLTVLALVVFFTWAHVHQYKQMKHEMKHQNDQPKIITFDQNGAQTDGKHITLEESHTTVHRYSHFSPANLVPFILPAVLFLVVVFSITRSIVLARQLIMTIEATSDLNNDVELNSCCEKKNSCCESKEETPEPAPVQPVAIFSPENVYVMPQTYVMPNGDGAYPGQLMPVYVDKLGQPIY
jgi:hypothetical protein